MTDGLCCSVNQIWWGDLSAVTESISDIAVWPSGASQAPTGCRKLQGRGEQLLLPDMFTQNRSCGLGCPQSAAGTSFWRIFFFPLQHFKFPAVKSPILFFFLGWEQKNRQCNSCQYFHYWLNPESRKTEAWSFAVGCSWERGTRQPGRCLQDGPQHAKLLWASGMDMVVGSQKGTWTGLPQPLVTDEKYTYLRQIHRISFAVLVRWFLLIASWSGCTWNHPLCLFFLPFKFFACAYMDVLLHGSFKNVLILCLPWYRPRHFDPVHL